jgi:hypothetical protein
MGPSAGRHRISDRPWGWRLLRDRSALFALPALLALSCQGSLTPDVPCPTPCGASETCDRAQGRCVVLCDPACGAGEYCGQSGQCLGRLAWSTPLSGLPGDVSVGADGRIYLQSSVRVSTTQFSYVQTFESNGALAWQRVIASDTGMVHVAHTPLGPGGEIYASADKTLVRLSPSGESLWSFDVTSLATGELKVSVFLGFPATVAENGTLYTHGFAALDSAGMVRWGSGRGPLSACPFAISMSSTRVVRAEPGAHGSSIFAAFDDAGNELWARGWGGNCLALPISREAFVIAGAAISPPAPDCHSRAEVVTTDDGNTVWRADPIPAPGMRPLIALADRRILLVSDANTRCMTTTSSLWAIDPDRDTTATRLAAVPWAVQTAVAGNDGVVYLQHSKGIAALDGTGKVLWNYQPTTTRELAFTVPALAADGCLLTTQSIPAILEYKLICLSSSSTGVARSAWPRTLGGNDSGNRAGPPLVP